MTGATGDGFGAETTLTVQAKPYTAFAVAQCYVSSGANGSDLPGRPKLQAVLNVVAL